MDGRGGRDWPAGARRQGCRLELAAAQGWHPAWQQPDPPLPAHLLGQAPPSPSTQHRQHHPHEAATDSTTRARRQPTPASRSPAGRGGVLSVVQRAAVDGRRRLLVVLRGAAGRHAGWWRHALARLKAGARGGLPSGRTAARRVRHPPRGLHPSPSPQPWPGQASCGPGGGPHLHRGGARGAAGVAPHPGVGVLHPEHGVGLPGMGAAVCVGVYWHCVRRGGRGGRGNAVERSRASVCGEGAAGAVGAPGGAAQAEGGMRGVVWARGGAPGEGRRRQARAQPAAHHPPSPGAPGPTRRRRSGAGPATTQHPFSSTELGAPGPAWRRR